MRKYLYYPFKYAIQETLVKIKARLQNPLLDLMRTIPDYPNSATTFKDSLKITCESSARTFKELNILFETKPILVRDARENQNSQKGNVLECSEQLRKLFDFYGSDKGSYNGYHSIYGEVIAQIDLSQPTLIVEIGIGSKNTSIPSNMGKAGKPGASLRAWKDLNEKVSVVGLDVDRDVLFNESRIRTLYHDQTSTNCWDSLQNELDLQTVDLFIDDGLHTPSANLCFLNNSYRFAKPGGWIIIEDIPERALPIWQLALSKSKLDITFEMLKGNYSYVLVANKKI